MTITRFQVRSIRSFLASQSLAAACLSTAIFGMSGCESRKTEPPQKNSAAAVDLHADHDHDAHEEHTQGSAPAGGASAHHHDAHETGPNGGHLLHLEPMGLHAEYVHIDQDQVIEVYAIDKASDVKACRMTLEVKGQEPKRFTFEPIADKAGGFRLKSGELLTGLKMSGEGVKVSLELDVGDQTTSSVIEHHEH